MIEKLFAKYDFILLILSLLMLVAVLNLIIYPEWHQYHDNVILDQKIDQAVSDYCSMYLKYRSEDADSSDMNNFKIHKSDNSDEACAKYKH